MVKTKVITYYQRGKELNQNGLTPIVIMLYKNGRYRYIKTGFSVKPECFDSVKERVVNCEQAYQKNDLISRKVAELHDVQYQLILQGIEVTPELLKSKVVKGMNRNRTFNKFYLKQLPSIKHLKGYKHHLTVFRKFNAFKPNLAFCQLNENVLIDFNEHLKAQGLRDTTRQGY